MRRYAVIGNPVDHSVSPIIHQLFSQQTGILLNYEKILAPLDLFPETVTAFWEAGGRGANITLPFKERAFEISTQKSQAAIDAQAVNTLVFHEDGLLEGCNTDGMGFIQDITHNQQYNLQHKRILIIGAGGAVRGIMAPLLEQVPASVTIANRSIEKARYLAEHFALLGPVEACSLDEFNDEPYDLIIHGTSAREHSVLHYSSQLISEHTWCYDLNYDTLHRTPFVNWAVVQGAQKAVDGLGMLVEQAAASYYIWHGIYPNTAPILEALRNHLGELF